MMDCKVAAVLVVSFICCFQQISSLSVIPGTDPIGPIDPFPAPAQGPLIPIDLCGIFFRCRCRYGQTYYTDSRGCRRCKCLPNPECPKVKCSIHCPNGFVENARGCQTCLCNPPICPAIACDLSQCPNGFEFDSSGCNTCRCKKECPRIFCTLRHECPFGRATDSQGCPTCDCKGAPDTCPPMSCPGNLCLGGFQWDTDEKGCLTNCRCKNIISPPTDPMRCSKIRCQHYCTSMREYSENIKECSCDCDRVYLPVEPVRPALA